MQRAFSLVELSIVLVILGLLTGGILAGQSLIRASELRKVTTDVASVSTAISTFRDKYLAMPGDMANATRFWSAADGGDGLGTDCYMANNNDATTCNGDGNGKIGTATGTLPTGPESYRFWHHLKNAGLYANNLTGVPASATYTDYWHDAPGQNIPRAPIGGNSGYAVTEWASGFITGVPRQSALFLGRCCLGGQTTRSNIEPAVAKPEEIWGIDTKMDDGKPGYGRVQIYNGYGTCQNDASNYALNVTEVTCNAIFALGQ